MPISSHNRNKVMAIRNTMPTESALQMVRLWRTEYFVSTMCRKKMKKLLSISSGTNSKNPKMDVVALQPQISNKKITVNGFSYCRKCGRVKISTVTEIWFSAYIEIGINRENLNTDIKIYLLFYCLFNPLLWV